MDISLHSANNYFKSILQTIILVMLCTLLSACMPAAADVTTTATFTPNAVMPTEISPTITPSMTATETSTPEPEITIDTWFKTYGGDLGDNAWDILLADDGGFFVIGATNIEWEPVMKGDIYLIRTDETGDILWEKTYGGENFEEGKAIIPTSDGGLILAGNSNSYGDSSMDAFLIKVDQDGNEIWRNTYGGPLDEMIATIQPTEDGGYIIIGNVVDPDDFVAYADEPGYGGYEGRSNIYLLKIDRDGNQIWSRTVESEENIIVSSGLQTKDDGFLVLATVMFFPEPDQDIYLLKVDESGEPVWFNTWEDGVSTGYALIPTTDGNYLISGSQAPPGDIQHLQVDSLFIKVDLSGNEIWSETFGNPEIIDFAAVLTTTKDGGFIAAGGAMDIPLTKIDADGKLLWQQVIQTGTHTLYGKIIQYPDEGYIIAGSTFNGQSFDIFVIKTDSQGNVTEKSEPAAVISADATSSPLITVETANQVELLSTFGGHSDHVTSLAISKDGSLIASASMDNTIKLWDVADRQLVHTFNIHEACVNNIAFSPDGHLLASSEAIWNMETMQILYQFEPSHCAAVAFSPDGDVLAVANSDRPIILWDVTTGQVLRMLDEPNLSHDIEFSPDGTWLAVQREPNALVQLWEMESGQLIRTFPQITERYLHSIAFSPDGQFLASAGGEGTTLVWDVATGQVVHTIIGNTCWEVAFSSDGSLLATAGCDNSVQLYNTNNGQMVRTLEHAGNVMAVVFSSDGTFLASGGYDNQVYLWGLP